MNRHKVFIIEDNRTEAMVIRLAFSGIANLDVRYYHRAEELLAHLPEGPDIVILDLMLPDMDGLTLIRKIYATHPNVRIVVMSAQESVEVISQVQREGVYNYVVKSDSCLRYIKQVIEDLLLVIGARKATAA